MNKKYEHLIMASNIYSSDIDKEFNFEPICLLYSASCLEENGLYCQHYTVSVFHVVCPSSPTRSSA